MADTSPEFEFCRQYRRWAKRVLALGGDEDRSEDPARTELLEEVWEFGADLHPWGACESLIKVLEHLYRGEDLKAAELLGELADEELESMRSGEGDQDGGE